VRWPASLTVEQVGAASARELARLGDQRERIERAISVGRPDILAALFLAPFPLSPIDWTVITCGRGGARPLVVRFAFSEGAERAWAALQAATSEGCTRSS